MTNFKLNTAYFEEINCTIAEMKKIISWLKEWKTFEDRDRKLIYNTESWEYQMVIVNVEHETYDKEWNHIWYEYTNDVVCSATKKWEFLKLLKRRF